MIGIENLDRVFQKMKITQAEFCRVSKIENSRISKARARGSGMPEDLLIAIIDVYPDLNLNWLISGKGKMFFSDSEETNIQNEQPAEARKESGNCAECRAELAAAKDKIIELQNQIISHLNNTKNG